MIHFSTYKLILIFTRSTRFYLRIEPETSCVERYLSTNCDTVCLGIIVLKMCTTQPQHVYQSCNELIELYF